MVQPQFTTTHIAYAKAILFLWSLLLICITDASTTCEVLKAPLRYTQEDAPTDLSGLLPVVVERINKVLEGVVDVEVEWTGGDLQGQVGEHFVQCKVTRLQSIISGGYDGETFVDDEGRNVFTQCFHVPFTIVDTNECVVPKNSPMRHQCHDPAICVNTIGSYECICPRIDTDETLPDTADETFWSEFAIQNRGPWEVSFLSTRSSCPGQASTYGCCSSRIHSTRGDSDCRSSFRCPTDPCKANHSCTNIATCSRAVKPTDVPDYSCLCPDGLMGNGHKCQPSDLIPEPKVKFDGKTPTEWTVKNNYFCDCTKPVVDACDGFPPCKGKHQICVVSTGNQPTCACKQGYVFHDKFGCVDERPPLLRLKSDPNGDQILRLKQGDVYKEYAVEIQDENAEEYLRSLKIAYSHPLPSGCLTKIGEFHVNYTVATPWTSPPYVRITRRVIIEDIDECNIDIALFERRCPSLVPRCDTDKGSVCRNTIGSYTCKCPKFTSGDGFQQGLTFGPLDTPEGFAGGTSCRDTGIPIIKLRGPNPKIFKVCECGGINGIMGTKRQKDEDMKSAQQAQYGSDIKELILATAGAELCATPIDSMPNASDCIFAYDETYQGRVDLSKHVVVGEPIKKTALRWSVPYDVKDGAGNAALTVWRDVVVEEVDLLSIETKIREDVLHQKKVEIQRAVEQALEDERKKSERGMANTRDRRTSPVCPDCPPCTNTGRVDETNCQAICTAQIKSCAVDKESLVIRLLIWLERLFPPSLVPVILTCIGLTVSFLIIRWILTLIFNPQAYRRSYYDDLERERALINAVVYHNGSNRNAQDSSSTRPSQPVEGINGVFSPQMKSPSYQPMTNQNQSQEEDFADIYQSPIITPSKYGDGVRRRTSYPRNGRNSM